MKTEKLNRTIFIRDNLEVLRCLDDNTVDLIYLDPPFNSNRNYSAPIGSKAAGQHFKDTWTLSDTDIAWWGELSDKNPDLYEIIHAVGCINGNSDKSYLIYMAMRILEMHRVLKDTGSIYLHCDQTMSHSLKLVLDAVFGKKNFRSEIIWKRTFAGKTTSRCIPRNSDNIIWFSKAKNYFYRPITKKLSEKDMQIFKKDDNDGRGKYTTVSLQKTGSPGPKTTYDYIDNTGKKWSCPTKGWRMIKEKVKALENDNRLSLSGKTIREKYYLKERIIKGKQLDNIWLDIGNMNRKRNESVGYSTQKPLALLQRIIKASCPENGLVLDPFAGCSTACIASEKLGRKWIGIDLSPLAERLVKERLVNELGLTSQLVSIRKDLPIKDAPKPSKNIKHSLYGKQKGYCAGCGVHFQFRNFHLDHIIPKAKGGQDTDKNLQLLCGHCNSVKGDRPMSYLLAKLRKVA